MNLDITLQLHRGISVMPDEVDSVMEATRVNGLRGAEGRPVPMADIPSVRSRFAQLRTDPDATARDLEKPPANGVFACGDALGAEYYACKHNLSPRSGKTTPIVITFDVPMSRVRVDCRDFLCPALQFWDRRGSDHVREQRAMLSTLYGAAVLNYFDEATQTADQNRRIFLCNLATFDPLVVEAHYANRILFKGQRQTMVASAFVVQVPVVSEEIIGVRKPSGYSPPLPEITLAAFVGR